MRLCSSLLAAACCATAPLTAQVRIHVGAGAIASSNLVRDSILEPIAVRPALAPALTVGLDGVLDSVYRVGVSVTWAQGQLESHTPNATSPIVTLAVWEPAITLTRFLGPIEAGVRAGLQVYHAERPVGIFRDGGTVVPALGVSATWRGIAVAGARVGLEGVWTLSRFSTTTLDLSGFTGEQTVQRVGVRLRVTGGPGAS